jgi:hypothetical protein
MIRRASVFACIAALGCQSNGGAIERLDSATGLTIVTERAPTAFARTETRFSRSARDYVYLGPVELNERGSREYFLWVGVGSTIDRNYLAAEATIPDLLYVDLDGEPMEFELVPWDEPAVAPVRGLAARVTLDQIKRISRGRPDSIRIARQGESTIEYFLWSEFTPWQSFADL